VAGNYYFLSDLHLGGDGELRHCDFADEFVAFLKELATKGDDSELIIGGDLFGFWETTTVQGTAMLDEIVKHHGAIFDQLRETGNRVKITLMAGNHDYDLACDPAFRDRLADYNIELHADISLKRELLGRTLWVEHGQQCDPVNASPDYGNRYALPVGYFITRTVVAGGSRHSTFGRGNWLKDLRSVATEQIPDWVLSNYFYREMGPVIRAVSTVFLLLLSFTVVALVGEVLSFLGIFNVNVLFDNSVFRSLGFVGSVLHAIVAVNMLILFFMLVVALPGWVVLHDVMKTLRRFRVSPTELATGEGRTNDVYIQRAHEVFAEHPETAVYLFGHTHHAFLLRENDRVILNMGTWLKILDRVPVRFGYLPSVYYPTFRLNYFHIGAERSQIVIRYAEISKTPARELGLLQRFVTLGRKLPTPPEIPEITTIDVGP
jgi:UDP-2,3-diacylglucosamine pyrophosphatase LpxH